jgi:hypothetical protein
MCSRVPVFLLKKKDNVFAKFKEFREFDKNQCILPMTFLRSNNGGECVSNDFEIYLS